MDTFLAIIGLVLTVMSMKLKHSKRMRYYIKENKNQDDEYSYLVTFWNSTKETIFKDDLYELNLVVPNDSEITTVYSNDQLPLKIGNNKKYKLENGYEKRKLSFDFLSPNIGYVLRVDTKQKDKDKVGLLGRLKGENKFSVSYCCNLYKNKWEKFFYWLAGKADFFQVLFTGLAVLLFCAIAIVYAHPLIRYGSISVIIVYVASVIDVIKSYSKPRKITKFIKKNYFQYKMIKNENRLFYYPIIDKYKNR